MFSKEVRKNSLVITAQLIATDSDKLRLMINKFKLPRDTKTGFGSSENLEFSVTFDAKIHLMLVDLPEFGGIINNNSVSRHPQSTK